MKKITLLSLCLIFTITIIIISCSKDSTDSKISDPVEVAKLMNETLVLPPGSFTVDPTTVEIDPTITIVNPGSSVVPLPSGMQMANQISFNAPNGNVNAVGMRFGTTGPIFFVPINTNGATSGTGAFDFQISPSICNNLSQICHDIKCYEFAQTTSGKISAANIRNVAMLCGNCDEPSCQGLVDPSDCDTTGNGECSFNFSLAPNQQGISCACNATIIGITSSSNWTVAISNPGSSGSVVFNSDYYINGCTSCPAIQITNANGDSYIGVSGSGSWNGNTFTFSGTVKSIIDVVNGGGTSYSLSGTANCN